MAIPGTFPYPYAELPPAPAPGQGPPAPVPGPGGGAPVPGGGPLDHLNFLLRRGVPGGWVKRGPRPPSRLAQGQYGPQPGPGQVPPTSWTTRQPASLMFGGGYAAPGAPSSGAAPAAASAAGYSPSGWLGALSGLLGR